ncbi:MAG: riboflavin synthase [Chitinophagaceae bacterium]
MFTGIIEAVGRVESVSRQGSNLSFRISSPISHELKIDQSVSHNGVCLTVERTGEGFHEVTAIEETLRKTNLGQWEAGSLINLERCLPLNGRLDGHFVQGHVDATGTCENRRKLDGSWEFSIRFPEEFAHLVIEKGSISINGISLTCFDVSKNNLSVAIIPYTWQHTMLHSLQTGHTVNLEFDLIGKYIARRASLSAL